MATSDELTDFVKEALMRGIPPAQVEDVLLRAGWSRPQVRSALAGYAALEFPLPVPRPRPYLSPRDAFLYLVLFSTLYVSAWNFGSLAFQIINRLFPDPAAVDRAVYFRDAMRWSVASLVAAFPVFLYLQWSIERALRLDPAKRASKVRRWLTYVTLFVAACALIALAPGDNAIVVTDRPQGRIELAGIFRDRGSQHGFAERHAIEGIIARDEFFRTAWAADQRIAAVARPAQRRRDEVDTLRDTGQRFRFTNQPADALFPCGGR